MSNSFFDREQQAPMLESEAVPSFFDRDAIVPAPAPVVDKEDKEISKEELQALSTGLKVRPEVIKDAEELVPFFGGSVKGRDSSMWQSALGFAADSLGFGLPQKAFIESQAKDAKGLAGAYRNVKRLIEGEEAVGDLTEDEINYLDRVRQTAVDKKSGLRWLAEAGVGLLTPGGLAAKAGKGATFGTKLGLGVAEGAAVGGMAGVGMSRRGEEAEAGLMGAGLGAGVGGGITAFIKGLGLLRGTAESAIVNNAERSLERLNVEDLVEKEMAKSKVADELQLFKNLAAEKDAIFTPTGFKKGRPMRPGEAIKGPPRPEPSRSTPLVPKLPEDLIKTASIEKLQIAKQMVSAKQAEDLEAALQRLDFSEEIKFDSMAQRFRSYHGLKTKADLDKMLRQGGPNAMEDAIDQWYKTEVGQRAVMKELAKKHPKVVGPITRFFLMLSDGKPVQMYIDNLMGTNLSPAIDAMSRKGVLISHIADNALDEFQDLVKSGIPKSIKELEAGQYKDMPPELSKFYAKLREVFNSKEIGLNLQDLGPNYIPNVFKSRKQVVLDVVDAFKKFGKGELDTGAEKDFKHSLEILTGFDKVDTSDEVQRAYNYFIQRPDIAYNQAQTTRAASAMERLDAMPMLLREDDIEKATISYMQNTFRHAASRDGLKEIRFVRDMIRKAATEKKTESLTHLDDYLTNLMADVTGTRTKGNWLYKLGQEAVANYEKSALLKATEATTEREAKFYKTAADLPDMLRAVNAFVYPNFIGLNPRSVLQNLSSPYFMNVGGMGGRYGSALAMEAALDSAALAKKGTKAWDKLVRDMGYIEPKFRGELTDAARDAMAASSKVGKKAVDNWVDLSMYFFNKSEKFARVQNHFMATRLADDLLRASKGVEGFRANAAKKFLDNIPDRAYRRKLSRLYNSGDAEGLKDGLRQYLNAQSMFNYNRVNMSEFGRVMGPVFSVFTKWPSTMYGRVFQQLADEGRVEGGGRLARMFLYPMLLAATADGIIEGMGAGDTPQHELLVGRRGVQSWTPGSNLMAWTSGEFLMPPMVQTMAGLGTAAGDFMQDKDVPKAAKQVERAVGGYVPFYNIAPLLLKRTPMALGEEPEHRTVTDYLFGD